MHNNTPSGWRPAITKLAIVCGLVYLIAISLPVLASVFGVESKWVCGASAEVSEALVENKENIIATGLVGSNDFLMTLWANKAGEWTLVATSKDASYSCVVIHGSRLKTLAPSTFI